MDLSVIIPTFGRAEKLARCLGRLAHQDLDHERFEVLIGVDGTDKANEPDDEAAQAVHALASTSAGAMRAVVHEFEHSGPGATRNKLVKHAHGKLLLFLNDDVLPEEDLLTRHVEAHKSLGRPAMVLGAAPWVRPREDTLFDRLVRETSMIFFYDRMDAALAAGEVGENHDWGFRHAWTLNLSLPRREFERIAGFDERLKYPCYEDLEFAHRAALPVIYRPRAIVQHDHRILPEDYLRRERMMGKAAWDFAQARADCAATIFGRDVRSDSEIEYSREFVERERSASERIRETFTGLDGIPADAVDGPNAGALLRALYEQHLLLKRWTWRAGLLEAAGG